MDGKHLLDLRSKINEIEAELNIKSKELTASTELLSSTKSDLEEKLSNVNKEIDELKTKFNSSEEENKKLNQIILDKKNENEIVKSDLDKALNNEKEMIQQIAEKNKEIDNLQNDLVAIRIKCDDRLNEINEFKTNIAKYQSLTKIIEDIREVMKVKGFLSDRELDQLLNKERI